MQAAISHSKIVNVFSLEVAIPPAVVSINLIYPAHYPPYCRVKRCLFIRQPGKYAPAMSLIHPAVESIDSAIFTLVKQWGL